MNQNQKTNLKNSKAACIDCNVNNFYKIWLTFLTPLHKLTSKSIEVAAELLKQRKMLSKKVNDPIILNKLLFGPETKNLITKRCKITSSNYYVVIGKLKKAGFITESGINNLFIPDKNYDGNDYHIHIMFHIK